VGGHADVWRFFHDGRLFGRVVAGLADPFRDAAVDKVAGIETRGFILGSAVARELDAGFVAIRKAGGLFPGPKAEQRTGADYRGRELVLQLQRESLRPGDRVLLVDDWFETGAQALAAQALVGECGAELVGAAVIVDELADTARAELVPLHALLRADELPDDSVAPRS
jgi:adenine phosphoribosyltransferase